MSYRRASRAPGFTLIELIASLGAASVLVVGLASALFVSLQAVDTSNSPAVMLLKGSAVLADMHADLFYALSITQKNTTSITFTIPDRDDPDSTPETICYSWSGTEGDPLTRQYNGGAATVVAPSVYNLALTYWAPDTVVEYVRVQLELTDSPGVFLVSTVPLLNRP